jgi:hypothetical protein
MAALTNLLISTNITLSSAMLLYAVGVGNAAVPMAGALNWVIKEGVGQAGASPPFLVENHATASCSSTFLRRIPSRISQHCIILLQAIAARIIGVFFVGERPKNR